MIVIECSPVYNVWHTLRFAGGATSSASRSDDSDGEEASALEQELELDDPDAPARTLNALNALRKARQHYDVLLAAAGEEVSILTANAKSCIVNIT